MSFLASYVVKWDPLVGEPGGSSLVCAKARMRRNMSQEIVVVGRSLHLGRTAYSFREFRTAKHYFTCSRM